MDNQNTKLYINIIAIIVAGVVVSKLNSEIKDFFSSDLIVFIIITLVSFESTKDILSSLAYATVGTMFVKLATIDDVLQFISEPFNLLYPGPNSSNACVNIKTKDLLDRFNGDSNLLKQEMNGSGVPHNLYLSDVNAPEIATYLINNPAIAKINDECKLLK
jgi:hypothetical protein